MKTKKNKIIIITIFIFAFIIVGLRIWLNKKDTQSNQLNYRILYKENEMRNDEKYYLYADRYNIYYLEGYNPDNIYILISSIGVIDEEIYNIAQENFKTGTYYFQIGSNHLAIENIVVSLHKIHVYIEDIAKEFSIQKDPNQIFSFDYVSYIESSNEGEILYYEDPYFNKIYMQGLSSITVRYQNENYELSSLLQLRKEFSENVYTSLNFHNNSYGYYDPNQTNIRCIILDNYKFCKRVINNEISYLLSLI